MSNTKYTSVLVVEDNQVFRNNLAESLSANHNVIEADSGMAALEILKSSIPDLIILDIMLPFPLDGLAVLRIIKNEAKLALIPVILISGIKTEQTILDGLQMGANDYMVKPFRMGELMLKSNNLVNIRQKMQKIIEKMILYHLNNLFEQAGESPIFFYGNSNNTIWLEYETWVEKMKKREVEPNLTYFLLVLNLSTLMKSILTSKWYFN